ncbi:hypothetical protein [uncultured Algibacter sp.]|uniref:hypothetical protein n=1 Tax=uncultured Algibacter sp. TaxID=298659 RepID=UPI0032177F24
MENFKKVIFVFALVFILGCDKDEDLPPAFQDATWGINLRPEDARVTQVGKALSFRDLSQGALSHEFIIEDGNKYLFPGYGANDSLPLFINNDLGLRTTNTDAHVLFLNQGINKVTIRNTFKDSLSFNGNERIDAVQENGVWVIENTWEIDVFGPLKPAFEVRDKNDNVLVSISGEDLVSNEDSSTWPVIQIEAGDALTYVDLTLEDRPNDRLWTFTRGNPGNSRDATAEVGYFSLGTFNAGRIQAIREGNDVPDERVAKIIPLVIEVIPSSQPFVFNEEGGALLNDDDSITFGVTGEIEPFIDEVDSFTVRVVNTAAGFDQEIPVISAIINSTDATKIDLILAEPLYNTDDITISYAGGNIESVDMRTLQPFSSMEVQVSLDANILVDPKWGFETAATTGNITRKAGLDGYWAAAANDPERFFFRNTDIVATGSASVRYLNPDGISKNVTLTGNGISSPTGIPAGDYLISYNVYLEPGNTMKMFRNSNNFGTFGDIVWDLESLPRGEWVEINQVVTTTAIPSGKQFQLKVHQIDNPGVTGQQVMYWDDLSWVLLERRP